MAAVSQDFVVFYSPGTFFAEQTSKPIEGWDVDKAVEMARAVTERYNARPYGFRFITRTREEDELDSSISASSGLYYLGGRVETLDEVKARNDPNEEILRSNMECNGWDRVVINDNSWRWTQPLEDGDTVLDIKL